MIMVIVLAVALGLMLPALRGAPLPVLLVVILAGQVAMLIGTTTSRLIGDWLIRAGLWLSITLVLIGLAMLWRRRDGRLVAAVVLAAIPALLVGVLSLLWYSR